MSDLSKRTDYYINSPNACPIAIGLLAEYRKHLKAANDGAERNMRVVEIMLNRNREQSNTKEDLK